MKQIMNRFDNKKEESSINDLRSEVNLLKEEIREGKSKLHKIEIEALTKQLLKKQRGLLREKTRLIQIMKKMVPKNLRSPVMKLR